MYVQKESKGKKVNSFQHEIKYDDKNLDLTLHIQSRVKVIAVFDLLSHNTNRKSFRNDILILLLLANDTFYGKTYKPWPIFLIHLVKIILDEEIGYP